MSFPFNRPRTLLFFILLWALLLPLFHHIIQGAPRPSAEAWETYLLSPGQLESFNPGGEGSYQAEEEMRDSLRRNKGNSQGILLPFSPSPGSEEGLLWARFFPEQQLWVIQIKKFHDNNAPGRALLWELIREGFFLFIIMGIPMAILLRLSSKERRHQQALCQGNQYLLNKAVDRLETLVPPQDKEAQRGIFWAKTSQGKLNSTIPLRGEDPSEARPLCFLVEEVLLYNLPRFSQRNITFEWTNPGIRQQLIHEKDLFILLLHLILEELLKRIEDNGVLSLERREKNESSLCFSLSAIQDVRDEEKSPLRLYGELLRFLCRALCVEVLIPQENQKIIILQFLDEETRD